MATIDTSEVMSRYLNKYCLDHIWNMPTTEYRQNFIARCVSYIPRMGSVNLGPISLLLPYNDSYYVYEVPKCCMGNLNIDVPEWVALDEWLDTNPFDFRVTGTNGEWLWRHGIYITNYPCQCSFIMAIEARMARAILGENYNFKKIYVSVYVDSDGEPLTNLSTECRRPTNLQTRNETWDLAQLADIVFINGRESQLTSMDDIQVGDYVELIDDPDIVSDFTVDLSQVGQSFLYRSTKYARFNYIMHIPKEDNPENYLITHNTCDIFVRPLNIVNARLKGLFLHRFNTTDAITQLTHNDFAISEILLNAYMEALGTTEIEIRVVARRHNKGLRLIREANYLFMLYQLTDQEILQFLVGNGDDSLPFWRADHLEQSKYVELMFKNPLFTGVNSLTGYILALGFYNTMSLICKRVTRTTIGPNTTHVFTVDLPLSMIPMRYIDAHVFVDGYHLDPSLYNVNKNGQYVVISIDPSVNLPLNTDVVVELFERTKFYAEYLSPTEGQNSLVVSGEVVVYRVREREDDEPRSNYFADQYPVDQTYEQIDPESLTSTYYTITENEDGTSTISFGEDQYGRTFLICSKRLMSVVYNKTFKLGELYGHSITSGMLMVQATQWSDGATIEVPLVHTVHPIVYLNGRELVRDVDYVHVTNKSTLGNITSQAIQVANSQYLNSGTTDNNLTIYVTTDPCFTEEDGFVKNHHIDTLNVLLYWYQELAMLTCDGLAVRDLQYENGLLKLPDSVRNGAIWYVRGMLSEGVNNMMLEHGDDLDTERCIAILEYFRGRNPVDDNFVVIPHSHHIYSVLVNEIMNDVINGDFTLVYDADLARMRDQVASYLTAQNQDAALSGVTGHLIVTGAGTKKVNQTYRPTDNTASGQARRWYNAFSNLSIWYHTEEQRWEIVSTLKSVTGVYYYAPDPTNGLADPSNLTWVTGDLGEDNPPVLESGMLDLTFIDILPSYRLYDSGTPEFYRTLEQLKRALLPEDPNRDIRVDQP